MLYHLLNKETKVLLLVNICIVVASDGLCFFFRFEIVPVLSLSPSLSLSLSVCLSVRLAVTEEGERMRECVCKPESVFATN